MPSGSRQKSTINRKFSVCSAAPGTNSPNGRSPMAVKRLADVKTKIGTASKRPKSLRPSRARQQRYIPTGGSSLPDPNAFDPRTFLTKLETGKSTQEYRANQSVFSQGDAADSVYYIQSGKVKLAVVSKRGKEAVIAILPQGSFFGESCLAGQLLRMSTASAVQHSKIMRVEKPVMLNLLHQEPEFAERFLVHLLTRNIRMEADLVDHLSTPARSV